DPGIEIFATDEKNSRDVSGSLRCQRGVIDAALVHDKRQYPLRFPGNEFVIELAAGGHTPQQEWDSRQFRMLRSSCERLHRSQQGLSAALADIHVIFNEALIVFFIGKTAAD